LHNRGNLLRELSFHGGHNNLVEEEPEDREEDESEEEEEEVDLELHKAKNMVFGSGAATAYRMKNKDPDFPDDWDNGGQG